MPAQDQPGGAVQLIERPELVIGLVGALGTDLDEVYRALADALRVVAYNAELVHVSRLISRLHKAAGRSCAGAETEMAVLMQQGDELRAAAGSDAAASLVVGEIRRRRGAATERESTALVVRSLKREEEIVRLRSVYGPRFVVVAAWSPRDERAKAVDSRLRDDHPGKDDTWYTAQTQELMRRDEEDAADPLGQSVREAFEQADVYLAVRRGRSIDDATTRVVRLLFGDWFLTPTRDEQAMYQASGAGMRSSAAGRQVGAVVVDEDGEVLVTGMNDVPKVEGGQYWAQEEPDRRDWRYGFDVNDRQKLDIANDILERLRTHGWLKDALPGGRAATGKAALGDGGPLRESRIMDLLEFGRIVHAEMACICTAARRGTPLRLRAMYSTTYPCHECARLIIAAGIAELVYVDAYPKSQVSELFADEVAEGPDARPDRVCFRPFEGVAPRLFRSVFTKTGRGRDRVTGTYHRWDPQTARPRLVVDADVTHSPRPLEDAATSILKDRLQEQGWPLPGDGTVGGP